MNSKCYKTPFYGIFNSILEMNPVQVLLNLCLTRPYPVNVLKFYSSSLIQIHMILNKTIPLQMEEYGGDKDCCCLLYSVNASTPFAVSGAEGEIQKKKNKQKTTDNT